ncbi:MAG: winged helix-turn-helix domain-containing protein [Parvularculaceae bacterium]
MKILIVEDDEKTAAYVKRGMEEIGAVCDVINDGRNAVAAALRGDYDIAIVDRMLPGLDGISAVKAVRASGEKTPVLFLSALNAVDDRVEGLQAGADDYLAKPFAFSELKARIDALLRRPPTRPQPTTLKVGDLELDLLMRRALRAGKTINLQNKEFLLLEVLMRNAGRIMTKTMLLEKVWDFNFDPQTSVVETHISRLRAKIDKDFGRQILHTVRGVGYKIDASS